MSEIKMFPNESTATPEVYNILAFVARTPSPLNPLLPHIPATVVTAVVIASTL
jgi:hypothetical protein